MASWRQGTNDRFVPFFVLADSRTGSTWLMDLLRSHPHIIAYDEVFHGISIYGSKESGITSDDGEVIARREADPARFMNEVLFSPKDERAHAVGFKVFYRHLSRRSHGFRLPRALAAVRGVRVVSLTRRNVLAVLVSREMAWGKQSGKERISLRPSHCLAFFLAYEVQRRFWERYFARCALLRVEYEELVAEPMSTMNRVLSHIGLEPRELVSSSTKDSREPLERVIVNYAQLRWWFRHTPWGGLFP